MGSKKGTLNRIIKIDITENEKELFEICKKYCRLSKELYNFTNYKVRQVYLTSKNINEGKEIKQEVMDKYNEIIKEIEEFNNNTKTQKINLDYKQWGGIFIANGGAKTPLKSMLKETVPFKSMPSVSSHNTIEQVSNNWKGFFESLKSYIEDKSKFRGLPKPPKYIKDYNSFIIDVNSVKIKNGVLMFNKGKKGYRSYNEFNCCNIKLPLGNWERNHENEARLVQIRIVPKNNKFEMQVVYEIDKVETKEIKGRTVAIDLGIPRVATVVNNIGEQPFTINGKPLKSYNKEYNKKVSDIKSKLKTVNNVETSKKLKNIHDNRNNFMETYMHQSASYIIKWCKKYDIDTIVIGKNKHWKDKCNLGKETQTFVQIPLAKLIDKIKYRAEGLGIKVVLQEESYTSKSSFIDNDKMPTYKEGQTYKFSGIRTKRGLYKSKEGIEIHADVNGAYNILRKYDKTFKYEEGIKLHPIVVLPNDKIN